MQGRSRTPRGTVSGCLAGTASPSPGPPPAMHATPRRRGSPWPTGWLIAPGRRGSLSRPGPMTGTHIAARTRRCSFSSRPIEYHSGFGKAAILVFRLQSPLPGVLLLYQLCSTPSNSRSMAAASASRTSPRTSPCSNACAVAIIDRDAQGRPCYRAINSCLAPLSLMAGRDIVSVEGVAGPDRLHPVQEKMVEGHGSQCGYCTPGFVMSLFEGYYRGDIRKHDQLDDQLCGNLCRCTGYRPIRDAAIAAFPERHRKNGQDSFAERLKKPTAALGGVEYEFAGERFFRPTSLGGLLQLLAQFPDGKLIAGATELGLDITKRFKKFPTLISAEGVPELRVIRCTEAEWRIGAAVTLTQIEEQMAGEFRALADMLRVFGSRQVRNRATMGGNLVTASPIGDSAPVLLALDASVVLASLHSRTGVPPVQGNGETGETPVLLSERTLPIDEFFIAYRKTALRPGEILKTIIVPRFAQHRVRRKCAWYKVSKRREMDISTVAACFTVDVDLGGVVRHARLAYGGVAAMPARARKTEQALLGQHWCEETVRDVLPVLP